MLELSRLTANYRLNDELLQLTQESFDTLETEYRNGKISYLDIITGLNDLLDAKVGFYSAHFALLQNIAQYRFYEGNLYDSVESLQ
jgi:outer membrane protein TolC